VSCIWHDMKTPHIYSGIRGLTLGILLTACVVCTQPLLSQRATPGSQTLNATTTGKVTSSTGQTLVIRDEDSQYQLFVYDSDTVKPRVVSPGATVRVYSVPGDEASVRLAREIIVISAPSTATSPATGSNAEADVVPTDIRRLERSIQRQARRYQAGVRAGVALDPELILFGAHAQVGPFFHRDVFFRPNAELAFGEVTTLVAINPEFIYRLPVTARHGRWSAYVGAGPGFNFVHQNFERRTGDDRDIDFGDFHSDVGFNILGGMQNRNGMFMELKTSIYTSPSPTLRLMVGYNF
jgi:hypothetical protein